MRTPSSTAATNGQEALQSVQLNTAGSRAHSGRQVTERWTLLSGAALPHRGEVWRSVLPLLDALVESYLAGRAVNAIAVEVGTHGLASRLAWPRAFV